MFSGSYRSGDVTFLLEQLDGHAFMGIGEKQRKIQSDDAHHGQLLCAEEVPSASYTAAFSTAYRQNSARMARDCLRLAGQIAARRTGPVTVVSLARAGTPVGVVVTRLLAQCHGRVARHFSVSTIRGRGIDGAALEHILALGHCPRSIVFVDGWTGKGVAALDLAASVAAFNAQQRTSIDAGLHVLSDLAGVAASAATSEDYLIPTCMLNATVSGLVSRTVALPSRRRGQFHGCVFYRHFAPHDFSQTVVDDLERQALDAWRDDGKPGAPAVYRAGAAERSAKLLDRIQERYGIHNRDLIKPGLGESTRVLLRSAPWRLIVRDSGAPDVAHLLLLARDRKVPVEVLPDLPYHVVSVIKEAANA